MANYPKGIERDYRNQLLKQVRTIEKLSKAALKGWLTPARKAELNEVRTDALDPNFMGRVRVAYDRTYSTEKARDMAREVYKRTEQNESRAVAREYAQSLGVEPLMGPANKKIAESFIKENAALIKDLGHQQIDQIEAEIAFAVSNGRRAEGLQKIIQERTGVAASRAKLIARDQLGSIVSAINRDKQQQLGIEWFYWETSEDERVREEHVDRAGKRYSWAKGADGEFPGGPINCRCTARGDTDAVLKELGI